MSDNKDTTMDTQKDSIIKVKRLSSDTGYYNNVFKKTEKTVSVILYVLSETDSNVRNESYIENIKTKALKTHEESLQTLRLQLTDTNRGLTNFQYTVLDLQSVLIVAETVGVIAPDLVRLVVEQLDAIVRYINNHYLATSGISTTELTEVVVPKSAPAKASPSTGKSSAPASTQSRQRRVNIPAGDISSDAYLVYSQLTDRAERIKTVLEAKPQATVKDIAEVITDVSEKTIQRELNSLIEKGQVVREGERRWSRYSVSK